MTQVIFWTLAFSLATAGSICLLGQRDLISGNLWDIKRLTFLLTNWKFILSMILALVARMSFVLTNNSLLKIPKLAPSSTTITTFITLFSLVLVVVVNIIFLKEKMNVFQGVGATLIMIGIMVMLK